MLFNSAEFGVFFVGVLAGVGLLGPRWRARKLFLLLASYVFYAAWNPPFVLLLLGSTLLDYTAARRMAATPSPRVRRAWLVASCAGNLGVLAFFKYGAFLLGSAAGLLPGLALPDWARHIVLPVGISFYTFQSLSYSVDVYRGRRAPARGLLDLALYVAFFPQLVAGPILRAADFLPQLERPRRADAGDALRGVELVARGLAKKVILADALAPYVEAVYAAPAAWGAFNHWLALYAFAFQIYLDFSGYSDIAIGTARLLGFRVPDNFRLPYLARDPREFWRRWHISLSTWLRDYLYIPLGGSRGGPARTRRNLFLTLLLGGLWHGAAWHFVAWGAFHGLWLVAHRALGGRPGRGGWARLATFHGVCLGWVLFRVESLADVPAVLRGLVDFSTPAVQVAPGVWAALAVAALSHGLGASRRLAEAWARAPAAAPALAYALVCAGLLVLGAGASEFIYFQF